MADVQDPAQTAAEPSMEEILASIRKIISDEQPPAAQSDVIELTQEVQDDGSVLDLKAEEPVAPPVQAAPEPAPAPVPAPPPAPMRAPAPPPVMDTPTLVSDNAVTTAASSLSSLANTVEIERLSSAATGMAYLGNGSRTLEDMAIELMRPLLKSWLDQNLPPIVEKLVQKEIQRIAHRAKD